MTFKRRDAQKTYPMVAVTRSPLRLRLLATSDLHAHILPWDDLTDQPAPERGLAQIASLIAQARAEVPGSLLLDNGDFLNGSPLADHIAENRPVTDNAPHPMIAAMNLLAYDAATLGNHEFSYGLPFLKRALSSARFVVVASNTDRLLPSGRRPFLPRYTLVPRLLADTAGQLHRVTVGVIGVLPPQTAIWERKHLEGQLGAKDILQTVQAMVPKLRRAGADVVVVLSHSGLGAAGGAAGGENVSLTLAGLKGVDAVIAGHTHQVFSSADVGPKSAPIVMPGFFGSHLGVIDLALEREGSVWQVVGHQTEVRPVAVRTGINGKVVPLVAPDAAIVESARLATAAMRQHDAQPVGKTLMPLHSFFSLIGHSRVQTLLAEAQAANMRRLLAGTTEEALPMLVSVAPFKAGGRGGPSNYVNIKPGVLTARNIADLYIHPNSSVALRVTGRDVKDWLERSVSLFRQITPGAQDLPLIDPSFPAFNFDMIHGATYQIDLTQPARFDAAGREVNLSASRIAKLEMAGKAVLPEQVFVLVTNSYRASGAAGFAGASCDNVVMEGARPLRQVLQEHVAKAGQILPKQPADWGFCPMPGSTVTFDSSPAAEAHRAEVPGLSVLGIQPTGFLRFRLGL